jgi:hypothetical protein
LFKVAQSIANHPAPHIVIMTGFWIPDANAPETDGPVGAAHLAAALVRIGIPVRLVTDDLCFNVVKKACEVAGLKDVPSDTLSISDTDSSSVDSILNSWHNCDLPVSHVIAIECPCPGLDGRFRNMRGEDITEYISRLHLLFEKTEAETIGIGDGGNELGMANVEHLVIDHIEQGEIIACQIFCNYLLVCSVSNWGGYGIIAALAILRSDLRNALIEGLNPELDERILTAMVNEGAVDGVRGQQDLTVDGHDLTVHHEILEQILNIINS